MTDGEEEPRIAAQRTGEGDGDWRTEEEDGQHYFTRAEETRVTRAGNRETIDDDDQRMLHSLRISSQLETQSSQAGEGQMRPEHKNSSNGHMLEYMDTILDGATLDKYRKLGKAPLASRAAFLKILATTKPGRGRVLIDFGIRGVFDDLIAAMRRLRPIKPSSRLRVMWDALILFFICYSMIMIPFDIAWAVDVAPWMILDVIIDFVFIMDVYLNFHTSYVGEDNDLVVDFGAIRNHYLKTWFVVDLIASIPFGSIAFVIEENASSTEGLNALKLVKIFRLLRMSHVFRSISDMDNIKASLVVAMLMIMFAVSAHWFACFFWKLGISQGPESWITAQSKIPDLLHQSQVEQYVLTLYWAMSTLTTLGYGDLTPFSIPEYVYVTFVIFCGAAMYAVLVSSVSMIVVGRFSAEAEYNRQMESLRAFNKLYHLPPAVKQRVRSYYDCIWERRKNFSGQTVMNELPSELRMIVASAVHAKMFQESLFKACDSYGFKHMFAAKLGPHVLRLPDDVLFFEDEKICHVYFVRNGLLNLVSCLDSPLELIIGKRQGNGYCGDIGLFDAGPRHAVSAVVAQYSEVCAITVDNLLKVLDQFPKEKTLFQRVADARREALERLLSEFDDLAQKQTQLQTDADESVPVHSKPVRHQREIFSHMFLPKHNSNQSPVNFWWTLWEHAVSVEADVELIDKVTNSLDDEASSEHPSSTNNTRRVDENLGGAPRLSFSSSPKNWGFSETIFSRRRSSTRDLHEDSAQEGVVRSLEILMEQQVTLQRDIGQLRNILAPGLRFGDKEE